MLALFKLTGRRSAFNGRVSRGASRGACYGGCPSPQNYTVGVPTLSPNPQGLTAAAAQRRKAAQARAPSFSPRNSPISASTSLARGIAPDIQNAPWMRPGSGT